MFAEFVRRHVPVVLATLAVAAFLLGLWSGWGHGQQEAQGPASATPAATAKPTIWTCSMHPQIRLPKPGKCPICGMTLIPLKAEGETAGPRQLVMSEAAEKLAEIQTSTVERKFVAHEVRMVGKVAYDETKVKTITAWVGGRLDRLYVDYTGVTVKQGDHMVYIYSPEVLVAERELVEAQRAYRNAGAGSPKRFAREILDASREKLRLWGLSGPQIEAIEKRGRATDHITINAPLSGIVIGKLALEGMYVKTGTPIYKIADLSHLWVLLDAYESDLPWLRYGQMVRFETRAAPGETFTGRIAFIDPILNPKTRTVRVRVNVPNPNFKLKPELFVHAVVRSRLSQNGKVMARDLKGKWISPMHPEVIRDGPGLCPVCGMPLVRAETIFETMPRNADAPLVVPATAVLPTGRRAVVYVALPNRKRPTFEGREIRLGPRAGDYYIVLGGLKEGERVVTNGNFKIDSALQIQAKPSMMSPASADSAASDTKADMGQQRRTFEIPPSFRTQLNGLVAAYLALQDALAKDDEKGSAAALAKIPSVLKTVDGKPLKKNARAEWTKAQAVLQQILARLEKAKNLEKRREGFALFSDQLYAVIKQFGHSLHERLYRIHCPMAFNGRGADWLQRGKATRNPYLGQEMPSCGLVKETLSPVSGTSKPAKAMEGSHGHGP